ncbi:protein unc-13 homolog isoform X1 [Beta vulgaris subsp. vulgaris]|uniref:protein unc-13 homolog isoform X1 n=1 Tax=Beta vulgaris subsp. vulgaris TaxID=3555 RepID=UPI0020367AC8|nr:protein unc-13 homolog isoform X1 [Beta vulgaris subsp. vulgaris]
MPALAGKAGKRMDTLLVPLELLCCISRTEFSDKKAYIRWQKRQLNMLEEGLINHPVVGFGESGRKANEIRILLAKIEEYEVLKQLHLEAHELTLHDDDIERVQRPWELVPADHKIGKPRPLFRKLVVAQLLTT